MKAQEVKTKWKKRESDARSRSDSDSIRTSGTETTNTTREMKFITSISSGENERLGSLIDSTQVDVESIEADALLHNHTRCTSILKYSDAQEKLLKPPPNNNFDILPGDETSMDMINNVEEQDLVSNMEVEKPEDSLEEAMLNWIDTKPVRKLNFHSAKKDAAEHQNNLIGHPKIEGLLQSSRVRRKNKANTLPPGSTPYVKKTRVRVSNASENDPPMDVSSSTTTGFTWNNPILERPKNLEIDWR